MSSNQKHRWHKKVNTIFNQIYPPMGLDWLSMKFNGESLRLPQRAMIMDDYLVLVEKRAIVKQFSQQLLTQLTSFFGIPNRLLYPHIVQSWKNILENFIGWEEEAPLGRKIFNIFKMPLTIVWHIILLVPKTLMHTIMLVTELIPAITVEAFRKAKRHCDQQMDHCDPVNLKKYKWLKRLASVGELLFRFIYFIGGAVTSPINNVEKAWKNENVIGGKWVGGMIASISVSITIMSYAIIFPFLLTATLIPATALLPAATHFIFNVHGIRVVSKLLSHIGQIVALPFWKSVFGSCHVSLSSAGAGLGMMCGLLITTIGVIVKSTLSRLSTQCQNNQLNQAEIYDSIQQNATLKSQSKWLTSTKKIHQQFKKEAGLLATIPEEQTQLNLVSTQPKRRQITIPVHEVTFTNDLDDGTIKTLNSHKYF